MEKLKQDLEKYPSSFSVKGSMPKKNDVKLMTERILLEIKAENEYDTDMEKHRTFNLISFCYYTLGDQEKAEEFNKNVLDLDRRNMIALSNKAWYCLETHDLKQCKELIEELNSLRMDKKSNLVAKAEIAFTISRFGIHTYGKATSIFKSVIDECEKMMEEHNGPKIPIEYLCVWLFGYALVKKRQMNTDNAMDNYGSATSSEKNIRLAELYGKIIRLEGSSNCLKRYRARSFTELGHLSFSIEAKKQAFPDGTVGVFPKDVRKEKTIDYYEEALAIFFHDSYVLEKSGTYFRYCRNIEQSIDNLQEAVKLKGTSSGYHHLALSLRRKLDMKVGNVGHRSFDSCNTKWVPRNVSTARSPWGPSKIHDIVKNPRTPRPIDYIKNKDAVDKIIEYLEKACTLSANTPAIHDKGLLYRQLGDSEKALDIFTSLVKNKDGHCSQVQLAKAYEQAAFCLHDILSKFESEDNPRNEKLEYKMITYLKSSLEIESRLVSEIPYLSTCWKSAPTLKTILSGKATTKENKQELVFLFTKLNDYGGALDVIEEMKDLVESDEERAELIQEKVKCFLGLKKYDDAVIALNLIACLPGGRQMFDEDFFQKVNIEAGVESLEQGNFEIAKQRIRSAFCKTEGDKRTSNENGECYDVFILCNPIDDGNGIKLMDILNQTGLNSTFNVESMKPGTMKTTGMIETMERSERFVILSDFENENADEIFKNQTKYFTNMLLDGVQRKGLGKIPLIMMKADAKVPTIFSHLPHERINMELGSIREDFFQKDSIVRGVKHLLFSLAKEI